MRASVLCLKFVETRDRRTPLRSFDTVRMGDATLMRPPARRTVRRRCAAGIDRSVLQPLVAKFLAHCFTETLLLRSRQSSHSSPTSTRRAHDYSRLPPRTNYSNTHE